MKPFYLVNISSRSVLSGTSDVALGVTAIDHLLIDSGGELPSVSLHMHESIPLLPVWLDSRADNFNPKMVGFRLQMSARTNSQEP